MSQKAVQARARKPPKTKPEDIAESVLADLLEARTRAWKLMRADGLEPRESIELLRLIISLSAALLDRTRGKPRTEPGDGAGAVEDLRDLIQQMQ
jgi:hypothetical protein